MFVSTYLFNYLIDNKDLPHISKYHRENYYQHCMLVLHEMAERTTSSHMLIAAALHDIAKTRTQGLNKLGELCFYGHEEIADEELIQFLRVDDPRYAYVKALCWCHMNPCACAQAKDFDKSFRKACQKLIRKAGLEGKVEVDDQFIADVMLLHEADEAGSIRSDEELADITARIEHAERVLATLR